MAITPELKKELLAILREEMEQQEQQKRENRTTWQRICRNFENEFAAFDGTMTKPWTDENGEVHMWKLDKIMRFKVKDAIGTLLRAIYRVDNVTNLPASKEVEITEFIREVLELMNKYRPEQTGDEYRGKRQE